MRSLLRPMGVREILDSTFTILRERFWNFQGVIFWSFLPAGLIFLLITGLIGGVFYKIYLAHGFSSFNDNHIWGEFFNSWGFLTIFSLGILLFLFIFLTFAGSLFFLHGSLNIFKNGFHNRKCKTKEAFHGIGKKWYWYLLYFVLMQAASMAVSIPFSIGSIFTAVFNAPWLYFLLQLVIIFLQLTIMFFFCLTPVLIAVEDVNVIKAITRSFQLPAKHRLRMLGSLIAVYLLIYAIFYGIILGLVGPPIFLVIKSLNLYTIMYLVFSILLVLVLISAMMPFYLGPLTAIYYDLVIRKEGYDIQLQIASQDDPLIRETPNLRSIQP